MPTDIGPVAQQGVVSTQIQQVEQAARPAEPPPEVKVQPVEVKEMPQETSPPPTESGRGANIDVTA